jgi:RNA polymerase sigma-70 factor (ECF subfamily)
VFKKSPGDPQDFDRLVNQRERALFHYVARRLDDRTTCEDVVNETFLIAWRRWDKLPELDRELPWLYAIAFRVLSNQRRSRDRRERLLNRLSLERDTQAGNDEVPDLGTLAHCLQLLNDDERTLLEFVYWERLSYRDIALVLDISENAAGIRITRQEETEGAGRDGGRRGR